MLSPITLLAIAVYLLMIIAAFVFAFMLVHRLGDIAKSHASIADSHARLVALLINRQEIDRSDNK